MTINTLQHKKSCSHRPRVLFVVLLAAGCLSVPTLAVEPVQKVTGQSGMAVRQAKADKAAPPVKASSIEFAPQHNISVGKSTFQNYPQVKVSSTIEFAPQLNILVGRSTLLRLPAPTARIAVGKPLIADAMMINSHEIYLLGRALGSTNLILWDKGGVPTLLDVTVAMDIAAVQGKVNQLFPEEKDIKVTAAADTLVLTGTVSDAIVVDKVMNIADTYVRSFALASSMNDEQIGLMTGLKPHMEPPKVINMLQVGAPQQVMLEVKVAEVSKNLLDKLGVKLTSSGFTNDNSWFSSIISGFLFAPVTGATAVNNTSVTSAITGRATPDFSATITGTGDGTLTWTGTGRAGASGTTNVVNNSVNTSFPNVGGGVTIERQGGRVPLSINIEAEKKDGLIKILAEPNIIAMSGQRGAFHAGGRIYIPVSQTSATGTTYSLEEKDFGVKLSFTPTVLQGGRINLQVEPEVSELSAIGALVASAGGSSSILPALSVRRASTTVQLKDGQSFAIGGLIKNNVTENMKAFPILGEIPILGALFRSSDFQNDRTELLFVVTPRLVKPLPADYKLPTDNFVEPTRSEFFLHGKLEGKREEAAKPTEEKPVPAAAAEPKQVEGPSGFEMK